MFQKQIQWETIISIKSDLVKNYKLKLVIINAMAMILKKAQF
jgi:hypothetical protein